MSNQNENGNKKDYKKLIIKWLPVASIGILCAAIIALICKGCGAGNGGVSGNASSVSGQNGGGTSVTGDGAADTANGSSGATVTYSGILDTGNLTCRGIDTCLTIVVLQRIGDTTTFRIVNIRCIGATCRSTQIQSTLFRYVPQVRSDIDIIQNDTRVVRCIT